MLSIIFAIVLLLLALASVTARKTYNLVPAHELKRQAAAHNALASELYRAVTYGASLRALLWIITTFSLTGGLLLLGRSAPWLVSFATAVVMVWLLFSWLPNTRVVSFDVALTRRLNGAVVWLLRHMHRPLQLLMRLVGRRYKTAHSGLYELSDIMDLLDLQSRQPDSRVSSEEIDLIRHVLQFGEYKVRDIVRSAKNVKSVAATDAVGPILLDELHASGQTSFPVKKTARSKEIVGTLHIGDVGIHSSGVVADHLTPGVTYIHEADSLADALHAFYQTRHQLFIVIDSYEDYVGVITLEDILYELVDKPGINNTLGSHDDRGSVAARHNQPPVADESQQIAESDVSVVE